ncbi:hypothetical protein ACJD0Z_04215 [Flavobacteriaceae bacterium M23B6Z8]
MKTNLFSQGKYDQKLKLKSMKYISTSLIFFAFLLSYGQNTQEEWKIHEMLDILNKEKDVKPILDINYLSYDSVAVAEDFDFEKLKGITKFNSNNSKKADVSFDNQKLRYVVLKGEQADLEMHVQIEDFHLFRAFYLKMRWGRRLNDSNRFSESLIDGFIIQLKEFGELFYFKLRLPFGQENWRPEDILSISRLNNKLFPTSEVYFRENGLFMVKDFEIKGNGYHERYYLYDTDEMDDECIMYVYFDKIDFSRVAHMLREKFHCPVSIEIVGKYKEPKYAFPPLASFLVIEE